MHFTAISVGNKILCISKKHAVPQYSLKYKDPKIYWDGLIYALKKYANRYNCRDCREYIYNLMLVLFLNAVNPVTEFSVSICSTLKFICSSDDGVPRLLITENDI